MRLGHGHGLARLRGEHGGVGLLSTVGGLAFVGLACILTVALADAGVAAARARTAADGAALAAMHASPLAGGDGDARGAAEPVAAANGARLVDTDAETSPTGEFGWPLHVEVTVESAPVTQLVRALFSAVPARSAAALAPPQGALDSAGLAATATGGAVPPAALAQFGNGRIPLDALVPVGVGDHRLWAPAALAFRRLLSAANAAGVTIGVTDSYRSYETQVDLAQRKGLYASGGLAAAPGTSNHGWGRAVDLDLDPTAQAWMRANAARFGFAEDVPREPWHWTYRGPG